MNKQRDLGLDVVRVAACLMVLLMHSPIPNPDAGPLLVGISFFTGPCIGLFFMVSGALLLPAKGTASEFLKHRIGKIVGPTVFWSLFYMVANIVQKGSADWPSTVKSLLSVPFSAQGYGVLWFMYTLAGLYIIAPVLSHWLEQASRKEIEFYLALWVVTMCYPLISLVLDVNREVDGILYYCTGYVGYFLLGYYLHRYGSPVGYGLLIPGCLVGVAALAGSHLAGLELDFYDVFWYLSVFMLIFCMAWFKFLTSVSRGGDRRIPQWFRSVMELFSNLSFGVYLMHIFIMRYLIWNMDWIQQIGCYPLQILVIFLLSTLITVVLCWIVSRIPYSEYIIGYHKKK